jgi:hypothetical protein
MRWTGIVLAGLLAGGWATAWPQATPPKDKPTAATAAPTGTAAAGTAAATDKAAPAKASPYHPDRFAGRAGSYYRLVWGVDSLSVKAVESGEVIRFAYRVLDASKAKALNDQTNEPALIDPRAGVKLAVPQMENVGKLRQSNPPEAGKSYWVAFSNKGRPVKRGDRVIVQIGQFRADGLVVD